MPLDSLDGENPTPATRHDLVRLCGTKSELQRAKCAYVNYTALLPSIMYYKQFKTGNMTLFSINE